MRPPSSIVFKVDNLPAGAPLTDGSAGLPVEPNGGVEKFTLPTFLAGRFDAVVRIHKGNSSNASVINLPANSLDSRSVLALKTIEGLPRGTTLQISNWPKDRCVFPTQKDRKAQFNLFR